MKLRRLDHAGLLVKDIKRSRQFYCEVLGMEEVSGLGAVWLRSGSAEIHLLSMSAAHGFDTGLAKAHPVDLAEGHITHIAFEVQDLREAQQQLRHHHIEIVCGPRPKGSDGEQLYICDPDGYPLELFSVGKK